MSDNLAEVTKLRDKVDKLHDEINSLKDEIYRNRDVINSIKDDVHHGRHEVHQIRDNMSNIMWKHVGILAVIFFLIAGALKGF